MQIQTLILGAGAAGLMAAAHAGPSTLVIDHAKTVGEKIRISGGGRCNFTNIYCGPDNFISANKHFSKSALKRFGPWDFLDLVQKHQIPWHEKTLGQLFCDTSAKDIIQMLLAEASAATIWVRTRIVKLSHDGSHFHATVEKDGININVAAKSLIVATGGKSIPRMGATGLAYDIAGQFGHAVTPTRAGLVPFTFADGRFSALSGLSVPIHGETGGQDFDEALLFTHRGLSGPAILQLSSYWREGQDVVVNLLPGGDVAKALRAARTQTGKRNLTTGLARLVPEKLVTYLATEIDLTGNCGDLTNNRIDALAQDLHGWRVRPQGTEGYRTAEVTLGGVSTKAVDSRTMMSKTLPGLFFVGECLDVTGWLGGYNFQWAWSSGVAAGHAARSVH